MEYLKEDSEAHKILFTGLDAAGKTSIILMLQRELSKFALLSPTRGAQRRIFSFLGKSISEWDLGGQENYRIAYLKNPDKYFEGTEITIYVIDILNKDRQDEALSYLKDVIEQFKKLEIEPPIFVFFHKYDPAIVKTSKNELDNTSDSIMKKISKEIKYKKIHYYKTSIYDAPSIIKSMSEILLSLYSRAELLQKTVEEFAKKLKAKGAVIIDQNSLIVSTFFKDKDTENIIMATTPYFLALNDSFHKFSNKSEEEIATSHMVVQRFGEYFIFKEILIEDNSHEYYIILHKEDSEFNNEFFETFGNLIQEVLK
ncbi:MAG: ADP-ribosylation factor-like protein [Promethearchaeota archaeon]